MGVKPGSGARLLGLTDQIPWSAQTEHEREEYNLWLRANPPEAGHNLYILLRHAMRYRRRSSTENMRVLGPNPDEDNEEAEEE